MVTLRNLRFSKGCCCIMKTAETENCHIPGLNWVQLKEMTVCKQADNFSCPSSSSCSCVGNTIFPYISDFSSLPLSLALSVLRKRHDRKNLCAPSARVKNSGAKYRLLYMGKFKDRKYLWLEFLGTCWYVFPKCFTDDNFIYGGNVAMRWFS